MGGVGTFGVVACVQEVAVTPGELLADADLIDYTVGASEKDEEEAIRAIPNPRPEDRRPKETRRPRSELIATPAEQPPIESGHSRNSDFGLLSGFGLRSSDFRAAEHALPSTGRTFEQPCL